MQEKPGRSPLAQPDIWDTISLDYKEVLLPAFGEVAREAIALVQPPTNGEVIDVACGPGTLALQVSRRVRRVVAIDFSSKMLEQLEELVREQRLTNVVWQQADGMALPFANNRFDTGFSCFGLIMFPDRACGFRELHRVVKPGAKVMVSSFQPFDGPFATMMESIREFWPALPFGISEVPLGTPDAIRDEMTDAGFGSIDVYHFRQSHRLETIDRFWAYHKRASAPVRLFRQRLSTEEWENREAAILRHLRRKYPDGATTTLRALIGIGRKS